MFFTEKKLLRRTEERKEKRYIHAACIAPLDTMAGRDDGAIVVRIHECRGSRAKFTLGSDYPVERIVPSNLLEHPVADAISRASVTDVLRPFEIRTNKLYLG